MSYEKLYEHEEVVAREHVEVPAWIDQEIDCSQIAAIIHGGCESGSYMPAVTYHHALQTMSEHGEEVFDFLEQADALSLPDPGSSRHAASWAALACYFLSLAVELWANSVEDELTEAVEAAEADEESEDG